MFGDYLTKAAFLNLVCQKNIQGRAVDTRWVAQLFGITKKTAIVHLAQMVSDGDLRKNEEKWRENAKKFYYTPTARTLLNYRKQIYRADYLRYLRAMMEA